VRSEEESDGVRGRDLHSALRTPHSALLLEVLDSGPGPPAEIAAKLFEPFVTGKAEGVGLGLAVARQVVESHGGRISWDREGGRTRFWVELPRGEAVCRTVANRS
jgi:nitrogen-specific signal transduction histidine kinase